MEKSWLIRTSRNQILGPISKEKLVELIKKSSLLPEDEICQGNGFWFKIREEELLQDYLYGSYTQNFNPITEAKPLTNLNVVLDEIAHSSKYTFEHLKNSGNVHLPSDDDLMYPDMQESPDLPDITRVSAVEEAPPPSVKESTHEAPLELESGHEAPPSAKQEQKPVKPLPKAPVKEYRPKAVASARKGEGIGDRYLYVVLVILLAGIGSLLFFYKDVLKISSETESISKSHE